MLGAVPHQNFLAPSGALLLLLAGAAEAGEAAAPQFELLDSDTDGRITAEEAGSLHGLKELLPHYDSNRDGYLDASEFQRLLQEAADAAANAGDERPTQEPEPAQQGEAPDETTLGDDSEQTSQ